MSGGRQGFRFAMLGRARAGHRPPPLPHGDKEHGMPTDAVARFLTALEPHQREAVSGRPREDQERLAAAWQQELASDDELDTLDELSPSAAEAEAARRVLARETE